MSVLSDGQSSLVTDSAEQKPVVDVSIGMLQRQDGCVLMAKRPQGKPSAGRWEFPGGKIESHESPDQALVRELREELGIELITARHWMIREHPYATMTARLHIFRVTGWHGEPRGCEGQHLSWQDLNAVSVEPLLPVNHSIIETYLSMDWTKA
jgi:8-oxo-dGTP diphosphatase